MKKAFLLLALLTCARLLAGGEECSVKLTVDGGEPMIYTVSAGDSFKSGVIPGIPDSLQIRTSNPAPLKGAKLKALLAGVTGYDESYLSNEDWDKPWATADLANMEGLLLSHGIWSATQISSLTAAGASKANIRQAIAQAAAELVAGDVFLLYISSINSAVATDRGDAIATYDADYTPEELGSDLAAFRAGVNVAVFLEVWGGIECIPANLEKLDASVSAIGTSYKDDLYAMYEGGGSCFTEDARWECLYNYVDASGDGLISLTEAFDATAAISYLATPEIALSENGEKVLLGMVADMSALGQLDHDYTYDGVTITLPCVMQDYDLSYSTSQDGHEGFEWKKFSAQAKEVDDHAGTFTLSLSSVVNIPWTEPDLSDLPLQLDYFPGLPLDDIPGGRLAEIHKNSRSACYYIRDAGNNFIVGATKVKLNPKKGIATFTTKIKKDPVSGVLLPAESGSFNWAPFFRLGTKIYYENRTILYQRKGAKAKAKLTKTRG